MKQLFAIIVLLTFLGFGCSNSKTIKEKHNLLTQHLHQLLDEENSIHETPAPSIPLPSEINPLQIRKYFKIGNTYLALVLSRSMNVDLYLPEDYKTSFTGILAVQDTDSSWTKFLEIKDLDPKISFSNNPYYLTINDKQLLLTIVDENGAGSGEGHMKVYNFSSSTGWKYSSCHYFGSKYSDPNINGDYFAFSLDFIKNELIDDSVCKNNVELISVFP